MDLMLMLESTIIPTEQTLDVNICKVNDPVP